MNQDIENIIKKWLKKHKDDGQWVSDYDGEFDLDSCCLDGDFDLNDLADEVLKVVVEKIREEINKIKVFEVETDFEDGGDGEYADRRIAVDNSRRWGQNEMQSKVLQLLSNLSPNKENKK